MEPIKLIKEFDNQYHCEITDFLDKYRKREYKKAPNTHNYLYIEDDKISVIDSHLMTNMFLPLRMLGVSIGYIILDEYRKIKRIRIRYDCGHGYKRNTRKDIQKFIGRTIEVEE